LVGLLRSQLLLRRIAISMLGGVAGGIFGGLLLVAAGYWLPYTAHALALTGTGFGIAVGST
jgi:hypothetical protein